MKTFDEAINSVLIQDRSNVAVAEANFKDLADAVTRSELAAVFLDFVTQGLRKKFAPIKLKKKDVLRSVALTAFISGIRVGQEMEKGEFRR